MDALSLTTRPFNQTPTQSTSENKPRGSYVECFISKVILFLLKQACCNTLVVLLLFLVKERFCLVGWALSHASSPNFCSMTNTCMYFPRNLCFFFRLQRGSRTLIILFTFSCRLTSASVSILLLSAPLGWLVGAGGMVH